DGGGAAPRRAGRARGVDQPERRAGRVVLGERLGGVADDHPVARAAAFARPADRGRPDGVGLEVVAVDAGAAGGAHARGADVGRHAVRGRGAGRLAGAGAADVGRARGGGRRRAGPAPVAGGGGREARAGAGGGGAGGAGGVLLASAAAVAEAVRAA